MKAPLKFEVSVTTGLSKATFDKLQISESPACLKTVVISTVALNFPGSNSLYTAERFSKAMAFSTYGETPGAQ
jgi:hypothetical protein